LDRSLPMMPKDYTFRSGKRRALLTELQEFGKKKYIEACSN